MTVCSKYLIEKVTAVSVPEVLNIASQFFAKMLKKHKNDQKWI